MQADGRQAIESKVIAVATETVSDWGLDLPAGISRDTRLVADLDFESMDIVQFAVELERAFGRKGLPFERLFMKDGAYVDDVSIAELADFLSSELGAAA